MATDIPKQTSTEAKNPHKSASCCFLNTCLTERHTQSSNKNQPNPADETAEDMKSSPVPGAKDSMNMVKAGFDHDQIPGRLSIERAIEESLAMKAIGIARNTREGETSSVGRADLVVDDTNHSNSKPPSPRTARDYQQPSAEDQGSTPKVAEQLNFEKQTNSEMEAYILDRLSALQPSFRTLFDPNHVGSSQTRTGHEGGKPKWRKRIEEIVGKFTNSGPKKQQQTPSENNLSEVNVKGILDMRWGEEEEERSKMSNSSLKQRTKKFCCSCPHTSSNGKNLEEWEFQIQLEKYSSTW